jgi:hypothetical protein
MALTGKLIALDPANDPYDGRFILNLSNGKRASARSASGGRYLEGFEAASYEGFI